MLPRVLFVYLTPSPFVLQDRDILRKHTEVIEFQWAARTRPARELARTMASQRRNYDVILVWFGDVHTHTAFRVGRLLRKPRVLIIGGYELSDVPGYGFLSSDSNRKLAKVFFARASRIVAVSKDLRGTLVRAFPETASKATVLPTGIDTDRFRPGGPRQPRVVSVAPVDDWPRALIKGWDRVVETARQLPDVPFLLVGGSEAIQRRLSAPQNVMLRGPIPHDELPSVYQQSSVVLHPSRSEGLPNALLEAMACACVPVATSVGGIPEAVGDVGFLTSDDPAEIVEAVRRALASPERGVQARERVEQLFSRDRRERGLVDVLSEYGR